MASAIQDTYYLLESFYFSPDEDTPLSEYLEEMIQITKDQLALDYKAAKEFTVEFIHNLH